MSGVFSIGRKSKGKGGTEFAPDPVVTAVLAGAFD
jgi:hypothetical protein